MDINSIYEKIINFFKAQNLWPYVIGEKIINPNDYYATFYMAAKEFGYLCSLSPMVNNTTGEATSLYNEFEDIYNGLTNAILTKIELLDMDESSFLVDKSLEEIAKSIDVVHSSMEDYERGIRLVLFGDCSNLPLSYDSSKFCFSERQRIIQNFLSCLERLIMVEGLDAVKTITDVNMQPIMN